MERLTQKKLILKFIEQNGSITPARLGDKQRAFMGGWIGSQADKRCRELRAEGVLVSEPDGKFERFFLTGQVMVKRVVTSTFVQDFLTKYPSKQAEKETADNRLF